MLDTVKPPGTLDFSIFRSAVSDQWTRLIQQDVFRTDTDGDRLWETYLESFPHGTNEILRTRREYDCGCCRQFIRAVGNTVVIGDDGSLRTLWDVQVGVPAFQTVCDAMAAYVRSRPICDVFLHPQPQAGADRSHEHTDGELRTWHHFHVAIPRRRNTRRDLHCASKDIGPRLSDLRSKRDVFLRGLRELTTDALDTVLEITSNNSLYRGNQYRNAVEVFRALKIRFDRETGANVDLQDRFAWRHLQSTTDPIARIRSTAIGTLLIDLSEGVEIEDAVRKFETSIMAPSNFKRPTALVSQRMVYEARRAIEDLGLTSALERRYANVNDISVRDVLFADRSARKNMRNSDPFDGVANRPASKPLDRVEPIAITSFLEDVVPNATEIELFLENGHARNLVSLIAPVHADAAPLFKWENRFSWSYAGDVADSIRERVKRAGGNVTGDLCCRLSWHNFDDLDLHMIEPSQHHIYYGNRTSRISGGQLDVDMNAGSGKTREPVENIFYQKRNLMREGVYELIVHQFAKRETNDVGFEVEVEWLGETHSFAYDRAVRDREYVDVAFLRYSRADGITFLDENPRDGRKSLPRSTAGRTIWGLQTQAWHRVSALCLSPNHWNDARAGGNLHYFFMLDGCAREGAARGFYNEFLRDDLHKHRKVLEIVGARQTTQPTERQFSGLGFSETIRSEFLARVSGRVSRTMRVMV